MKNSLLVVTLLVLSFCLNAETIKLVTSPWPPFEYEKNGKLKGTDIEIINEAFKRMKKDVNIKIYPWKRCVAMVKNKKADGIFTLRKTSEREEFLIFPNEVLSYSANVFFRKKGLPAKFTGKLSDLSGKTICITAGYDYGKDFMKSKLFKLDAGGHDDALNFKKLLAGRSELFLCDKLVGSYELKKLGFIDKIDFLPTPLSKFDMFLAFTKNNSALAKEFSKALKSMKSDGTYDKIISKYLK